jgi:hypothetical protein
MWFTTLDIGMDRRGRKDNLRRAELATTFCDVAVDVGGRGEEVSPGNRTAG